MEQGQSIEEARAFLDSSTLNNKRDDSLSQNLPPQIIFPQKFHFEEAA